MHGLETIVRLNNTPPAPAPVTAPCEAMELQDITDIVLCLRLESFMPGDRADRTADYLVAAYGIEE